MQTQDVRMDTIKYICSKPGQMLVFCRTKAGVDRLTRTLRTAFLNNTYEPVFKVRQVVDEMFKSV